MDAQGSATRTRALAFGLAPRAPAAYHSPMARLFLLLGAAIVVVLVFFPDEVASFVATASQIIGQLAVGAAGYYGAAGR